jgi:hypothetical protein
LSFFSLFRVIGSFHQKILSNKNRRSVSQKRNYCDPESFPSIKSMCDMRKRRRRNNNNTYINNNIVYFNTTQPSIIQPSLQLSCNLFWKAKDSKWERLIAV